MRRPELGQQVLDHVAGALDDISTVASRDQRLEGRQLTMMLEPQA